MKKNIAIFLSIFILLQSCSVYKPTEYSEIKKGKNYIVEMNSGKEIEARCSKISSKSAYFKINELDVEIPFEKIKSIKRKKVSPVILIGGTALAVLVGVLVIKDNKKDNVLGDE